MEGFYHASIASVRDSDLLNVCFGLLYGLKSDISRGPRSATTGCEHGGVDTERPGCLQVDDKLEFGRLQHWQVGGGLRALEDLTAHYAGLTKPTRNIGPVAHQPPDLWKSAMSYCHMSFDWCSEAIANAVGGKCISVAAMGADGYGRRRL
jgi:hypothetical protein